MSKYLNLLSVPFTDTQEHSQTLVDWDKCISDNIEIPFTYFGKTGIINVLERRGHLLKIIVSEIFPNIPLWISDIDLLTCSLNNSVFN